MERRSEDEIATLMWRIIKLLRGTAGERWLPVMEQIRNRFLLTDNKDEAIRDYMKISTGGMGSFGDLILHKDGEPLGRENLFFERLCNKLYRDCVKYLEENSSAYVAQREKEMPGYMRPTVLEEVLGGDVARISDIDVRLLENKEGAVLFLGDIKGVFTDFLMRDITAKDIIAWCNFVCFVAPVNFPHVEDETDRYGYAHQVIKRLALMKDERLITDELIDGYMKEFWKRYPGEF